MWNLRDWRGGADWTRGPMAELRRDIRRAMHCDVSSGWAVALDTLALVK
jgi:hypothetical protein